MLLTVALSLAFLVVIVLMVVRRRNLSFLMGVASLIGAVLVLIWLQDLGLLPGSKGPLTHLRPQTVEDSRR